MDIAKLGYEIDSSPAVTARKNLDQMGAAAGRAQTATEKMQAQVQRDMKSAADSFDSATKLVRRFIGALASIQTVRALVTMADNWSDLTSRVQIAIGAQGNAAAVMQRLSQVSRQTYSSLQLTAEGFARNATTLNALNVSTEQQLDFAQALNNALVISGAKADRAQMVQNSLAKAMAEGALRGEELNNVLNYGSRVAEVLADEMGVNVTQLRALGAEGKITSGIIFNSLVGSMEALTEQAESMPATVGDAFTLLQNAVLGFVGITDQATQTTSWLAEIIITVADAIDILGPQVAQLAQLWSTQDAEQGNAAHSAAQLAEGMKVVVTGLILAKNAIDVLVSGLRFMVGVGVAAAAEIINSFGEVAKLPEIVSKMLSPASAAQGLGEFVMLLDRNKDAVGRFADEAGRLAGEFAGEWDTNVNDVANAFAFLEGSAVDASDGVKRAAGEGVKFNAAAAGMSAAAKKAADEARKLAAAQRAVAIQRSADAASFLRSNQQLAATLAGPLAQAQLKYNQQAEEANRLLFEGSISSKDYADAIALYGEELERARAELEANTEEARWLQSILDEFNNTGMSGLVREIERVGKALEEALTPDQKEAMLDYLQKLQGAAGEFRQQGLETMVGATQQVLGAIQGLSKEGSKAYKAMEVASHALNVVLAIGAILNQGKGDPYTAFARMAAMAVAVAGLVGSIGANFGGSSGMTDTAAERQATQGRGSVLGDPEAQSQSIANATQITADATSELVGINRGMLNALTALQGGLDRAGGMLARGANRAPFTEIGGSFSFRDNFLGGALSFLPLDPLNILGGSSQITDQGIRLGGGSLGDLDIMGFQEQQYRRWRFGSRRTREELVGVSEELESQFQMVVNSIVETVRQGALALGMLPGDIEAALEAFRLEEIRISLKDLSAEEQRAELLAVLSTIFDNLAGEVVPYIAQFQRVGEGLGETLVRVATSVQVTQEAMTRLGFSLGELDPQTFAEISVNLVEMVGGINEFASAMRSFVGNFAPEAHQLAIAQDDLTRAFAAVGLTVPATRDGMWALMQSLDATTEAGQEQIATLLRLAGVADSYYTMLERQVDTELQDRIDHLEALLDANRAYYDFAEDIARQFAQSLGSDLTTSLIDIERTYRRNVATANELARAAGMAGAAERELARIELIAARQRAEAIRLTEESARSLAGDLGLTELSQLDAQISAFEAASQGIQSSIGGVSDAFDAAAQRAKETIDLLIGDLSPLRDAEKLQIALQGLQAGTVSADQVLQIGRRLYGSGNDYRQLFDQVLAMRPMPTDPGGGNVGGGGGPAPISPELQALLARRDEILAAQAAQQARANALTLVEQIGELAQQQALSFEEVAAGLGIDLRGLADILEVDDATLNAMLVRQAEESAELQEAVLEMPDLFAEAVEPITDELVALREQVADLIAAVQDVARNTADTAAATGATATTTANRDLIDTSSAPRSSRIGIGSTGTGSFGPGGRTETGLVPARI